MASTALKVTVQGRCVVQVEVRKRKYKEISLAIMQDLCDHVILGHDFLQLHESVAVPFGGPRSSLVCGLTAMDVPLPTLFPNLTADCKPIATRSRRHTKADSDFIVKETQKLLSEGVIEPSRSPWRSQVHVTTSENHKRRMVINYSATINRFTQLDAYPLPLIEKTVNEVAKHKFYSTLDLKSAYHQVPIRDDEKLYTAFEAGGRLYQFRRIPFGVTNGVACFQRIIDIIQSENLKGTYAYLDNITVCGMSQEEHDQNLERFLEAAKKYNLAFNHDKSIMSTKKSVFWVTPSTEATSNRTQTVSVHFWICRSLLTAPHSVEHWECSPTTRGGSRGTLRKFGLWWRTARFSLSPKRPKMLLKTSERRSPTQ